MLSVLRPCGSLRPSRIVARCALRLEEFAVLVVSCGVGYEA
jgi:hypothetical protein